MAAFKNTANGHTEYVGGGASGGVFFFGAIYLAIKGLWAHFFIWVVVVVGFTVLTGGPGLLIALPLASIIYALSIQGILESSYLKRGWVRVEPGNSGASSTERACPFCAETIKSAAVKCKHCGAELEAEEPARVVNGWVAMTHCRDDEERKRAAESIEAERLPIVTMNGFNIGAGPFVTKDEAKDARIILRDRQRLFCDVQYRDSVSGKFPPI